MENYIKLIEELTLFNEQRFWELLSGEDIFEIKRPSGNIYVSILGNAGIDTGLIIYRHAQELYSQLSLMENIDHYIDQYARLEGIRIYLTGGQKVASNMGIVDHLKEHDALNEIIALVSNYGQQIRLPDEEECEELIEIVREVNAIQAYYRKNNLNPESLKQWDMFSFDISNQEISVDSVEWPIYYSRKYDINVLLNEHVEAIKAFSQTGKIGIGIYFLPTHNKITNEYPSFCVLYDINNDRFLEPILIESHQVSQLYEQIAKSLIKHHCYPREIVCTLPEVETMLENMTDQLEIETYVEDIKAIEELMNYTMESTYNGEDPIN